ncbi:hypothetical protein KM043_004270 [Ampulex compressa]|nr:hypothetical protein KM043_004270 [Ampulex compressa]
MREVEKEKERLSLAPSFGEALAEPPEAGSEEGPGDSRRTSLSLVSFLIPKNRCTSHNLSYLIATANASGRIARSELPYASCSNDDAEAAKDEIRDERVQRGGAPRITISADDGRPSSCFSETEISYEEYEEDEADAESSWEPPKQKKQPRVSQLVYTRDSSFIRL